MATNDMTFTGSGASLVQNTTGSAPTAATEGMPLKDLTAVSVVLEVNTPASRTLSGAGSLLCYVYDPLVAGWSRHPTGDLTVTLSGVARQSFDPLDVACPRNARVVWIASGVTVSAGTTVTVYQLGNSRQGVYS